MSLVLYGLAAGIGAALNLAGKYQENVKASKEIERARKQWANQSLISDKQYFLRKAQMSVQMKQQTLSADEQLKELALEEFHEKGKAAAAAGMQGMGEGTIYSNLMLMSKLLRQRASVTRDITLAGLEATKLQGEIGHLQWEQDQLQLDAMRDRINEAQDELNWNQSIWSYGISAVQGALSGLETASNIEGIYTRLFPKSVPQPDSSGGNNVYDNNVYGNNVFGFNLINKKREVGAELNIPNFNIEFFEPMDNNVLGISVDNIRNEMVKQFGMGTNESSIQLYGTWGDYNPNVPRWWVGGQQIENAATTLGDSRYLRKMGEGFFRKYLFT